MSNPIHTGMQVLYASQHHGNPQCYAHSGTLVGIVPRAMRKDTNIFVIVNHERNVKRVSHLWNERGCQLTLETVERHIGEHCSDHIQSQCGSTEPPARPDNKTIEVKAYQTTDNKLHDTEFAASRAQLRLDFYEWGDGKVHPALRCSRGKLLDFLIENKTDISAFLRRVKAEKKTKRSK